MSLVCAAAGALLGAMMFGVPGMLAGGCFGWLVGTIQDLQQRQGATEKELAWVRRRLAEQLGAKAEGAGTAAETGARVATRPETAPAAQAPEEEEPVRDPEPQWPAAAAQPAKHPVPGRELPSLPQERDSWQIRDASEPPAPSPFGQWLGALLSGENLLVKLGVVIIFFGISFLVKYAAQHGLFPVELRLCAAALGGCALLATGWKVRELRPGYAQAIQGGGIGILYLTTYGAMSLYQLIPAWAGFVLLVTVCLLSAVLAVLQESPTLAFLGSAGGFLAPELSGIGNRNPALLFGYYAVLNCGICALALKRAWRGLNLLGFFCTFMLSALWGSRFYTPAFFFTVEPFLVLFFLMYVCLPVLYARRHPAEKEGFVDAVLVFGTPVLAFAFQAALVRDYHYGLAWSALAAASFFLAVARRLFRSDPRRLLSLAEAYLALGVLFGTLTIPLAFEGRWTSATWSIEGAALVWTGLRQKRLAARSFGYLLLVGSGVILLAEGGFRSGVWPVLNSCYLGTLLVGGAALLSARLLGRDRESLADWEQLAEPLLFAWGMLWWFASGLNEVGVHTVRSLVFGVSLAFVALSCCACHCLGQRLGWRLLEWPALGLLPALALFALLQCLEGAGYPSLKGGWFGWPLALGAWYLILSGLRLRLRLPRLHSLAHAAPFWLVTLLAAWEVSGLITHHLPGRETWAFSVWGALPALAVLLIARRGRELPWPVQGNYADYLGLGCAPLALGCTGWLLSALTVAGNPAPLPYFPLVNPLDGASLLVLVSLISWQRCVQDALPGLAAWLPRREAGIFLASLGFLWLNAVLLHSIHHWLVVPYTLGDLFASLTVQAALSIFWSLLALGFMTSATRRRLRPLWVAGASLLGVVVGKLFLVDLAGRGSVSRIVSFVVVGVLILLIGWFAPVPPRSSEGGAS
jgi:uncharacterized membrane protein